MNGQELLEKIVDKLFENRAYTDVKLVNATFRSRDEKGLARGYITRYDTPRPLSKLNLLFYQIPTKRTILVLKEKTSPRGLSRPNHPVSINLPGMFFGISYVCGPDGSLSSPLIHVAPCDSRGKVLENIFPNTGTNYEWRLRESSAVTKDQYITEAMRRYSDICTGERWNSGAATFTTRNADLNRPDRVLEAILDGISKFWSSSFAYDSDYITPEVIEFVKDVTGFDLKDSGWRYSAGYPGKFAKLLELASEYNFDWDAFPKSNPKIDLFTKDYIGERRIVYRRDAVKRRIQEALADAVK